MKHTMEMVGGSRYNYDWTLTAKDGWAQFDTVNDASYYGHWVNAQTLTIVAYIEGEFHKTVCDDMPEFISEVRRMIERYGDEFKWIDAVGVGIADTFPQELKGYVE